MRCLRNSNARREIRQFIKKILYSTIIHVRHVLLKLNVEKADTDLINVQRIVM